MLGSTAKATALVAFLWPNLIKAASEVTGFPPCDALISAGLGHRVLLATADAYESRVQSWWSTNARLRPWCFVQPYTTEEVSIAVRALADSGSGAGDWHIAVRSGGHSLPGTNNIADGVTIDLGMMNSSHYDFDHNLASVEPGAAWKDVYYNLLQNDNVTVTGGRDGGVGVGGFLLGGGISYYSFRNGFGCDTVMNYEVVLANGSIVKANANEHTDLWKALKGGGLNFGIVTRFDLQAMPAVELAYGQSIIASNYSDEVVDALFQFTDNLDEPGDDASFTVYMHDTEISEDTTILVVRVNTKGDLNTTAFDRFNDIPTLTTSWEHESLADAANGSQIAAGTKNTQATLTFANSPSILRQTALLHSQLVSSLSSAIDAENFNTQMVLQPLPPDSNNVGHRNGSNSNMHGLERNPSKAILWTFGVAIKNGNDAALAIARAEVGTMTSKLKDFASANGTAAELVYMNYADTSQDPLGSYGPENVAFMKDVARQYDPEGWWQRRVPGGFKLERVDD